MAWQTAIVAHWCPSPPRLTLSVSIDRDESREHSHSLDSAARREVEGGGGLGGAYESTESDKKLYRNGTLEKSFEEDVSDGYNKIL